MSDTVVIDASDADDFFKSFPNKIGVVAKKFLTRYGRYFLRGFVENNLTGRPGLFRRSGDLAKSFDMVVTQDGEKTELKFWTRSKYAHIHEKGWEIKPKGHPYLAIPIGPALTPAGASKFESPMDVVFGDGEGLVFMKKKGGKPFLGTVINGKVVVYFLLRESVNIPARLRFESTFTDQVQNRKEYQPFLQEEIDNAASAMGLSGLSKAF